VSNRKAETAERQARLAAIQAAQRRSERRRTTIIAAVVGVVVLALIGVTLFVVAEQNRRNEALEEATRSDIEGVETYQDLSANHVEGDVEYAQTPPVGGDHSGVWQNCGVYAEAVQDENAVHSMEHGAVWIAYDPSLAADQVELLEAQAESNNYVLVSPYEDLPTPVVASAWGLQLQLEDASDERLSTFVRKYVRGEQTPEPGAPCTGGTGTPE
jgi:hypothetical protein